MADDDEDKKHAPGGKSLNEALDQGNIPRSTDLVAAGVVLISSLVFTYYSEFVSEPIFELNRMLWSPNPREFDLTYVHGLLMTVFDTALMAMAVPLLAILLVSVAIDLAQTQGHLAWGKFKLKWDVFDPWNGLKGMFFSIQPVIELGKSLVKLFAVAWLVGYGLGDRIAALPKLAAMPPHNIPDTFIDIGWAIVTRAFPIMLAIGAADYGISYWRWYKQLKRTDQEVKDEAKDQDGSPEVKKKIKQRAREISLGQMLQAMTTADVLITNPTHYAVALRYKRNQDEAPVVVAKGADRIAFRLREEAIRLDIPRIEDKPLARALYRKAKIGRIIPAEWYGPVAKVLAVVYRRRAQRNRARTQNMGPGL